MGAITGGRLVSGGYNWRGFEVGATTGEGLKMGAITGGASKWGL